MSKALLVEAVVNTVKAVIRRLDMSDEERLKAFGDLFPVVQKELEKYAEDQRLMYRRLYPTVFGRTDEKENQ